MSDFAYFDPWVHLSANRENVRTNFSNFSRFSTPLPEKRKNELLSQLQDLLKQKRMLEYQYQVCLDAKKRPEYKTYSNFLLNAERKAFIQMDKDLKRIDTALTLVRSQLKEVPHDPAPQ
jgi:small-conductance mechanosensitive channel